MWNRCKQNPHDARLKVHSNPIFMVTDFYKNCTMISRNVPDQAVQITHENICFLRRKQILKYKRTRPFHWQHWAGASGEGVGGAKKVAWDVVWCNTWYRSSEPVPLSPALCVFTLYSTLTQFYNETLVWWCIGGGGDWCWAVGCSNSSRKCSKLTFHHFLREKSLWKRWIRAVRREDWVSNKNSQVHSDHFKPDSYDGSVSLRESYGLARAA